MEVVQCMLNKKIDHTFTLRLIAYLPVSTKFYKINVLKFQTLVACATKAKANSADPYKKQSDQGLPCLLF